MSDRRFQIYHHNNAVSEFQLSHYEFGRNCTKIGIVTAMQADAICTKLAGIWKAVGELKIERGGLGFRRHLHVTVTYKCGKKFGFRVCNGRALNYWCDMV